ncbi:F-box/kelch-repeat protein At3g23880-like [Bidens hawaiensis]|uniref:F-box/kelch-repeat protein At3g23880-like n=1 Tax=Bidens hawaiensis TaxID=980011 RepID=UPI00404A75FB
MALEHKHQRSEVEEDPQSSVLMLFTEIIVQILLKLPVDSLLRCKSVCKSWYSLISDPHFVKSHLAISTTNINRHRLIYSTNSKGYSRSIRTPKIIKFKTCSLRDVMYGNSINALELDYPSEHPFRNVWVGGSCNGLLCMNVGNGVLFIWNPSTRNSYRLPPSGCDKMQIGYVVYGFGYQQSTDDYKVVELSCYETDSIKHETLFKIYSLKSGNWKKVGVYPHRYSFFGSGNYCNGVLHWAAMKDFASSSYTWFILSLDLATETFGEVLQPVYDEGDKELALGSLKEWLCVLCNYRGIRTDVWVMKVYGVADSWTKLVSIPCLTDPGRDRLFMPLCISNDDGKFLLKFGWTKLIVYDSKNNSFSEIQNSDRCLEACTFVESLVSPMPTAGLGDI